MGGYGSTRWAWHSKKRTVGDSRVFDISRLIHNGDLNVGAGFSRGSIAWWRGDEKISEVGFTLRMAGKRDGVLTLDYTFKRTGVDVTLAIPLHTTRLHSGGVRWWGKCPHCGQRVAKLYLPPGARRFLCRTCHDLSYASAQQAHQYDRSSSPLIRAIATLEKLSKLYRRLEKARSPAQLHKLAAEIDRLEMSLQWLKTCNAR